MAAKSRKKKADRGPVAVNKRAYRNYELIERFEAGLSLLGTEVKSLRAGQADLAGSYARVENGQGWLVGASIAKYEKDSTVGHEPIRKRKLLLHKTELHRIQIKLDQRGFTFVPLRIYFNDKGLAKVELALARGKRKYDKRTKITERAQKREVNRGTKKYHR